MKRFLIVGQGPNGPSWARSLKAGNRLRPADPVGFAEQLGRRLAVTGACGEKLAQLAGISPAALYQLVDRMNLNARWIGKEGKGDRFDRLEALRTAEVIREESWPKVILLGKEVARAFEIRSEFLEARGWYHPKTNAYTEFLVFPHPSGISIWWNEEFNTFRAGKRLQEFLEIHS
jgi:hypothetical protein